MPRCSLHWYGSGDCIDVSWYVMRETFFPRCMFAPWSNTKKSRTPHKDESWMVLIHYSTEGKWDVSEKRHIPDALVQIMLRNMLVLSRCRVKYFLRAYLGKERFLLVCYVINNFPCVWLLGSGVWSLYTVECGVFTILHGRQTKMSWTTFNFYPRDTAWNLDQNLELRLDEQWEK